MGKHMHLLKEKHIICGKLKMQFRNLHLLKDFREKSSHGNVNKHILGKEKSICNFKIVGLIHIINCSLLASVSNFILIRLRKRYLQHCPSDNSIL